MAKSEPTLVPEWLKGTGGITGAGSTTHHFASSSLQSDRTSSAYSRRSSSSNGSIVHDKEIPSYTRSYSAFARSHRDRDWEKDILDFRDKERSVPGDHRDLDFSDPLVSILTSRIEKDTLRRSQSMVSGKRGEVWPRKVAADLNNGNINQNTSNGLLVGGSIVSSIQKAAFERDFPSLGAEEKPGTPDIGRVSSPGLSSAVQSLPMGSSALIGGDGWTSALAEVPMIIGNNGTGISSVQQATLGSSASGATNSSTGLNMAETLAQAPSRARISPQLSVETQRLEELAIKQSRQLIPMTPSMPKTSVLNSLEKAKPKISVRTGEMNATKTIQQQQLSSLRGAPMRSDVSKTSHGGKLLVLKAPREKNGISPIAKDGQSPTNVSKVANNPLALAPSAAFTPLKSPNNSKLSNERKSAAASLMHGSSVEKRPTTSQVQSRNDFFNLMRKKTSGNLSSAAPDPSPVVSSSLLDKSTEQTALPAAPVSPQSSDAPSPDPSCLDWSTENGSETISNGNASEESQRFLNNGEKHSSPDAFVYPDEEEAAFLRSLGWDENAGEEEGLTEEEISAFYKEYMKLRPSSKLCRGSQQQVKLPMPLESRVGSFGGASSGLSSSDSESEA
ncbi:PREDICTED: uncharacterized protein LOC104588732 isoform X2 [Nelumbo nucifera]|uniref:Uncharacterized protein LOC104588732 isoform X2 n=1 Tax=Nelumbo nucifera TaxID=4432 RepID=A0A1U7ZBA6_NELNU|nr:PREDICTED: uncharacterized protein LOC104588732 isoform X2 [Nelumbo nucifera]